MPVLSSCLYPTPHYFFTLSVRLLHKDTKKKTTSGLVCLNASITFAACTLTCGWLLHACAVARSLLALAFYMFGCSLTAKLHKFCIRSKTGEATTSSA